MEGEINYDPISKWFATHIRALATFNNIKHIFVPICDVSISMKVIRAYEDLFEVCLLEVLGIVVHGFGWNPVKPAISFVFGI